MKWIYVEVWERDIAKPMEFDTVKEARAQMRKDFLNAIGKDTVEEIIAERGIDLTQPHVYLTTDEFEISPDWAWANDCANHDNWDAKIFKMS